MKFPVFDLHCDTATELFCLGLEANRPLRANGLRVDLQRASQLEGFTQCFAFWNYPGLSEQTGMAVEELFRQTLRNFFFELERNSDLISQARTGSDVQKNLEQGKLSAILTLEGTAAIGFEPERLEELAKLGFRMSTLTWNEGNPLAGSHLTGEGLSHRGREFVKTAQALHILVDVSHISDRAFWDIMDMTEAPIVASHSNSRAIHNVSRNLTDDMFREICRTGGVVGLNLYNGFLGADRVSLEEPCRHILHWLELDPEGDHIALGGDLDGCNAIPTGFAGVQSYDKLAEALLQHGLGKKLTKKLFWDNAMGVMNRCCM